ncbi:ABC transporter, fused permease protein [hydrothermal vent metagenome]|uniref:ABC transporter, fused permease protein n=1 Tax=hydrothermal vent metagenome TaxID=652676 RepID=A0A3B0YV53_9ZZZZ
MSHNVAASIRMSWRMLRRDWRAGELTVLSLALVIAVGSVTSVGFFTDRVRLALENQANTLLGADLVVISDQAIADDLRLDAERFLLKSATSIEFPSMMMTGERNQLVSIKAVESPYPLRGELRISQQRFSPDRVAAGIPESGSIWVDMQLLDLLGVNVNDVVRVGEADFKIAAILTNEPARASGQLFSLAPRVMLNLADIASTELITPASRVRHRMMLAGEIAAVANFRAMVEPRLKPGQRMEGIEEARPEVRSALERARRFLGLAAMVSVLLAGVAVATSSQRFIRRHLDSCAVMRCVGGTQQQILSIFMLQMLWLGLIAGAVGCLLGFGAQFVLVGIVGSLADFALPAPSLLPILVGLLTGLVTQFGFALPPLLHLKNVPSLRVLRRDLGALPTRSISTYGLGFVVLSALIVWQAGDLKLGLYVLGGLIIALLLLAGVAFLLLKILGTFRAHLFVEWRFGVTNLMRRPMSSVAQVIAFGLGIMVLLLFSVIRDDLLDEWGNSLPDDAPNRFLINIQPDQIEPLSRFFSEQGLKAPTLYPMIRGRLVEIGGEAVRPENYENPRAQHLLERQFNLSWAAQMQVDNQLIAGEWWSASESEGQFSVEEGLAKTLSIEVGDTLVFVIDEQRVTARVSNLRSVEWDSFRPNFFVIASPGVLESYSSSYMSGLYLPENEYLVLDKMVRQFPNITVIDIAAVMTQVRIIIERVTLAVEYVFLFTLIAGLLVMYAAIYSTLDERIRESVILRTLGAGRRRLLNGVIAEFVTLGALAGMVAASAASLLGYILAVHLFQLEYQFNAWVWLIGIIGGGAGIGFAGVLGTRKVLNYPPLLALREV